MKKLIHPRTSTPESIFSSYREDQLQYVVDCYVDVLDDLEISIEGESNTEEIKSDYMIAADAYDLSDSDFEDIYNTLESLGLDESVALIETL